MPLPGAADRGSRGGAPGADRHNDAAGLVIGNDGIGIGRYAGTCPGQVLRAAVLVQVGPAHAGGLHFKHHFPRSWRGIGESHDLDSPFAGKHDATHGFLRLLFVATKSIEVCRLSLPGNQELAPPAPPLRNEGARQGADRCTVRNEVPAVEPGVGRQSPPLPPSTTTVSFCGSSSCTTSMVGCSGHTKSASSGCIRLWKRSTWARPQ